jgi:hypothetical protein
MSVVIKESKNMIIRQLVFSRVHTGRDQHESGFSQSR